MLAAMSVDLKASGDWNVADDTPARDRSVPEISCSVPAAGHRVKGKGCSILRDASSVSELYRSTPGLGLLFFRRGQVDLMEVFLRCPHPERVNEDMRDRAVSSIEDRVGDELALLSATTFCSFVREFSPIIPSAPQRLTLIHY